MLSPKNMKFTKNLLLFLIVFSSCSSKKDADELSQMHLPYKLINLFSKKIKPKTDLVLISYGINLNVPKGYQYKNGVADFKAGFYLNKSKNDLISLGDARKLVVFLCENFRSRSQHAPIPLVQWTRRMHTDYSPRTRHALHSEKPLWRSQEIPGAKFLCVPLFPSAPRQRRNYRCIQQSIWQTESTHSLCAWNQRENPEALSILSLQPKANHA